MNLTEPTTPPEFTRNPVGLFICENYTHFRPNSAGREISIRSILMKFHTFALFYPLLLFVIYCPSVVIYMKYKI